MGIKLSLFDFVTGMIKIGITAALSSETSIDPSLATFIGDSATALLSSLSFEKKTTIKARIDNLPYEIMPVVSHFTMPDKCREDLAHRLFTLERLKKCVESENIVDEFKSMIVDICSECSDCDLDTLQTDEISTAISARVMSIFLEDKALSDIVSLFINRATYEVVLSSDKKLDLILETLTSLASETQSTPSTPSVPLQVSWVTTLPYVPPTKYHIKRDENENATVQNILKRNKVAISGIVGGIGKTELLRLVCKKVLEECTCSHVGWIYYSGNFQTDIRNALDPEYLQKNDPIKSLLALDYQFGQDMILFIDNVDCNNTDDDLDILRRLNCKVIVSTRNQYFYDFDMEYLDLLRKDIATKMFQVYSNQREIESDHHIELIVELCGRHPLTIELVAKYAKKRKIPNRVIYSELLEYGYNLDGLVDSNWNGNKNELIIAQLSKLYELSNILLNEQTIYILKCFSILPSYPLAKSFADCIVDGKNADYANLDALVDSGWISSSSSGWYMHNVVKNVITRELEIHSNDCNDCLVNICKYAAQSSDYLAMNNALTLLLSAVDFFSDEKPSILLIRIYNNIGYVYQEITDYKNAKDWFTRGLDMLNCVEANDELLFNKALLLNNMGQISQHTFQKKLYRGETITAQELLDTIAWYDNSLKCYETLQKGHTYSWLEIERRKLVAEHNKLVCIYYGGYRKTAISLAWESILRKIHIINHIVVLLSHYYKLLLNSSRYKSIPVISEGYKSLESLVRILQNSNLPFDMETGIDHNTNEEDSLSSILDMLKDYRFTLDNELIPSFIRSCDQYADLQCDYVLVSCDQYEIAPRILSAEEVIQLALDLCETIEKVTIFEGAAWGTLSKVYYAMDRCFPNVSAKDAAIHAQKEGIKFLECIFKESNAQQSKEPLIRAYKNMYAYTKLDAWKEKAERLMNPL